MATLALEVELNGKRLVVAGAEDLVLLSAQLGAGVGSTNDTVGVSTPIQLTVMGLSSPKASLRPANLSWISGLPLRMGDLITFRIVQVEQPDPPANVLRTPTSEELAAASEKERSGLTTRSRATRRKRRAPKRER